MSNIFQAISGKAILAPLAGISNLPFRLIVRSFGCPLCFTEMVSANGLVRKSDNTTKYLKTCPEDSPLGVQIFGADPAVMAQAAANVAELGADLININMGCPVKKVVKTGAGVQLMNKPQQVAGIVQEVKKAVSIPVTIKIRSGLSKSSINAVEIARIAQDYGAEAVIVHGRTADQGFSGRADWRIIAQVKKAIQIPVIGNGDIWQPDDAFKMIAETGCDAVMVGRGALGNPWIFQGINQLLLGEKESCSPSLSARFEIIKKHWELESFFLGDKIAARTFRKHMLWYTKGQVGSSHFRQEIGREKDSAAMMKNLNDYFETLERLSD